jgi:hypothetical protein
MGEYTLQIISISKILWCTIFAGLYGFGGISNKWIRRFVAPFWIGIGIWLFGTLQNSFSFLQLLYPLLLSASLHIGYGGDDVITKIRRRAFYGFVVSSVSIPLLHNWHFWLLYLIHIFVSVSASVVLGAFNPTKSARDEETILGLTYVLIPMFLI